MMPPGPPEDPQQPYPSLGVAFLLLLVTLIAYSRNGTESVPWKVWVTIFSALGVALAFLLRRGVNLTARYSGVLAESDRGRIVVGKW